MSGAASPIRWTYEEFARLPDDGNRYEVLDGQLLVTPAPTTTHQRVVGTLYRRLDAYVRTHDLGEVFFGLDVLFAGGHYLCPDILFVPDEERVHLKERGCEGVPALVVEVLSTSSKRHDLVRKPARYGDFDVAEYWVVDPWRKCVYVWDFLGAAERREETARVCWQPDPRVAPLEIVVPELFEVRPVR